MTCDAAIVTELDELLTAIEGYDDPRRASNEWKQAFRLLQKTDAPSGQVTGVVGMRDPASLRRMIDQLRAPETDDAPETEVPDGETCKRALKAFRKRLKLTRLDEESRLGRGPLSKGAVAGAYAISPPVEWPDEVWQELTNQGKLRYVGQGMYELGKE
jgi:hypothetical protein